MRTFVRKEWLLIIIVGFFIKGVVYTSGASEEDRLAEGVRLVKSQNLGLQEALITAKAEIDYLKVRIQNCANKEAECAGCVPGKSATVRDKEYLILDVNEKLGMVIINGGRRDGVKPGLMFNVINEDRSMTTVRVVDARATIAGAVIQNMDRELPKVRDRAIFAAGSKN